MSDAQRPSAGTGDREPAEGGPDQVDTETMGDEPEREGGLVSNTGDEGEAPTG